LAVKNADSKKQNKKTNKFWDISADIPKRKKQQIGDARDQYQHA